MLSEITYAGNKSSDHGLVIERFPLLNRPSRKYEKVSVPGRNGDIYFKQDAWNNYTQEYEVWSGSRNAAAPDLWANIFKWLYPEERGTTVEDILNLEVNGYHQLIDTYEPNTIRLAQFNEETEVENSWNNFGKSIIRFDCRPERFTADAFEWIDISEEQTTKSGDIVTFDPSVIIEAGQGKNKADVADTTVTDSRYFANLTDLTPSGTYTISFDYVRTGEVTIVIMTSTFNYFPLTATSGRFSGTVTATAMGAISVGCHEITGSLSVSNFQCEEGTEATEYEPYELVADLDTAPYVQSLTAEINAVQSGSGDPSPTNIRPISGYSSVNVVDCGKNLLNGVVWTRGYFINASGVITSATANMYSSPIPVIAGEYTYNYTRTTSTSITTRIHACDKHGNWIRQIASFVSNTVDDYNNTITVPSDVEWVIISTGNNTSHLDLNYFCLTDNIPVESYSEGSGVHTISLGSTIYGGTLDVTNGVLTVDKGYVDLGSLTWSKVDVTYPYFRVRPTGLTYDADQTIYMCSNYSQAQIGTNNSEQGFFVSSEPYLRIRDSRFYDSDATAFKTAMSGVQFVYPVTPTTVTLTPTQVQTVLGHNNIWADSGTVEVVINKPILNETARTAKPCLKVYGSGAGTVYCNGTTITISDIPQYIYIDSDSQNCFKEISDANLNSLVSLSNGFPVLSAGGNNISWSGGVTNVEVMPRWWNL